MSVAELAECDKKSPDQLINLCRCAASTTAVIKELDRANKALADYNIRKSKFVDLYAIYYKELIKWEADKLAYKVSQDNLTFNKDCSFWGSVQQCDHDNGEERGGDNDGCGWANSKTMSKCKYTEARVRRNVDSWVANSKIPIKPLGGDADGNYQKCGDCTAVQTVDAIQCCTQILGPSATQVGTIKDNSQSCVQNINKKIVVMNDDLLNPTTSGDTSGPTSGPTSKDPPPKDPPDDSDDFFSSNLFIIIICIVISGVIIGGWMLFTLVIGFFILQ